MGAFLSILLITSLGRHAYGSRSLFCKSSWYFARLPYLKALTPPPALLRVLAGNAAGFRPFEITVNLLGTAVAGSLMARALKPGASLSIKTAGSVRLTSNTLSLYARFGLFPSMQLLKVISAASRFTDPPIAHAPDAAHLVADPMVVWFPAAHHVPSLLS